MIEQHVKFIRNDPKSKVELLFVKNGWTLSSTEDSGDKIQDAFIIRSWHLRNDGNCKVNELKLKASEMEELRRKESR